MESLYLLIPFSVVLVFVIGVIFWWSLKSGQMDDLEGPAYRVLMDDDRATATPGEQAPSNESVDADQSPLNK
ncbi:MAG: cbb3-type cytochrome oxidase assembly protein CcoS [Rhodocyclaceae bacterium]|nr:cbb3-type cytochrome oxidase assembly protein CcoS [Rhodocyclaceae bacterium]